MCFSVSSSRVNADEGNHNEQMVATLVADAYLMHPFWIKHEWSQFSNDYLCKCMSDILYTAKCTAYTKPTHAHICFRVREWKREKSKNLFG